MWQTFLIDVIKKVAVGESSDSANLVTNASETKVFLKATQGEVGTQFRAILLDNGEPYHVSAGAEFSIWYEGASGKGNYTQIGGRSPVTLSGNVLQVELIPQMTSVAGGGVLAVMLHGSDGSIRKLFHLTYIVDEFPGYGSEEAKAYFTAFSEAVADVKDSAAKVAETVAAFETDKNLSVAGKAADAAATGEALAGKAPAALGAPYNYLDNSDFRNPVNQRGQTSYLTGAAGYTFDRWFIGSANSDNGVNIISGGVEVVGVCGTYGANLRQYIPIDATHKTMTFAVYDTNGNITVVSGKPVVGSWIKTDTAWGYIGLQQFEGKLMANIRVTAGNTHAFRWAALYEGGYTAETLPEYKPKGYGAELAECQRYFYALSGAEYVTAGFGLAEAYGFYPVLNTPVPMRIHPTVVYSGNWVVWDGSSAITFTSLAVNAGGTAATNCSQVSFQVNGAANLTVGKIYLLTVRNDGQAYMWLSADL